MTERTSTGLSALFTLLCFFGLIGVFAWAAALSYPRAAPVECTNPPIELRLRVLRLDNGDAFLLVTQNGDSRIYLLSSSDEARIEVSND